MSEKDIQKQLNSVWSGWKIAERLGEGSYGMVYLITREEFGHVYEAALKVITIPQNKSEVMSIMHEGMDGKSVTSYFYGIVEDVVKEFVLMSQMKGNSNIVSYEDHAVIPLDNTIGWNILIRMELLTPLLDYTQVVKMSVRDALKLGIDICKALEICSMNNIIHRDVKPENIFVSKMGDFKLGDFGIARQLEKTTGNMSKRGTVNYMAPEIYKGEHYDETVDIYSLGLVLYRLLNRNRLPFLPSYPEPIKYSDKENAVIKRISGEPLPNPCNAKGEIARIILKACAYDPKERYQSAGELRTDLEQLLASGGKRQYTSEKRQPLNTQVIHNNEKKKTQMVLDDNKTMYLFGEETTLNSNNPIQEEQETEKEDDKKIGQQNTKRKDKFHHRWYLLLIPCIGIFIGSLFLIKLHNHNIAAMPELVNMPYEEAEAYMEEQGIELIQDDQEYSDKIAEGSIISQNILTGSKVKRGDKVTVVVSKGAMKEVPDVIGLSVEEAEQEIAADNLTMDISKVYSDDIPKGIIISQSPEPKSKLEPKDTVSIVVSLGTETVEVPEMIGMTIDDVGIMLENARLKYDYTEEYSDEMDKGIVIYQSEEPGNDVKVGTRLNLIVSKGAEPTTEASMEEMPTTQAVREKTTEAKKSTKNKTSDKDNVDSWDLVN